CSRTAPCKTFAGAISKTTAKGEINCLDGGGFGVVTIQKSLTISCEAGTGGILTGASNGIVVDTAATDSVTIRGLDIEGGGFGLNGIDFIAAGTLHVEKSHIHDMQGSPSFGIRFAPTGAASLFVSDTVLTDNGNATEGGNILVSPTGNPVVSVSFERVRMSNGGVGLRADGNNALPLRVEVADSVATG